MGHVELERVLKTLSQTLDARLESILGKSLPELRLRPAIELKSDLVIALNQRYELRKGAPPGCVVRLYHRWIAGSRGRIPADTSAYFHIQVPYTVYYADDINPHIKSHSLYNPERTLAHEAVHARILSQGNLQDHDETFIDLVARNVIWRTLQEGIADYLGYQVAGKNGKDGFEKFNSRVTKIVEQGRDPALVKKFESHYYGLHFMRAVSEQLGEIAAVRLALNPFHQLGQRNATDSDDDLFALSLEEIKNPNVYIKRMLKCAPLC